MKFVVRPAARADILRQFRYYVDHAQNPLIATRFLTAVESAVKQICEHPDIGAPKTLKAEKLTGLRSWPVKGFPDIRVYYLISKKSIRVVRILHGKRDIL